MDYQDQFKGDLKRFKLELTDLGHAIITKIEPHATSLRKLAIAGLDSTEFEIFLKILDQIGENYGG